MSIYVESRGKYCQQCNSELLGKYAIKFCSRSCAAKFNNKKKQPRSEGSRLKTSVAVKEFIRNNPEAVERNINARIKHGNCIKRKKACPNCNQEFISAATKYCSMRCANEAASKRMSAWLKENRDHLKGRSEPSYMERTFREWLIANGLEEDTYNGFKTEVHFYNNVEGKNIFADFVFESRRLIIELDGSHHKARVELDEVRDEYLRSQGWYVLRITHAEYKNKSKLPTVKSLLGLE